MAAAGAHTCRKAKILILDDEPANLDLLREVLRRGGYENVRTFLEPPAARDAYLDWQPDLLLVDLHMPRVTGLEWVEQLQAEVAGDIAPVIVLTADATQ